MKLIFTTNKKPAKIKWPNLLFGQGPIPMASKATVAIVKMVSEGLRQVRGEHANHDELLKVEVQTNPKLKDQEVRKKNDQVCQELDARLDHIEIVEKHFKTDGTVVIVLKRRREELYEASSQFVELYHKEHGLEPPGPLRKKVAKFDSEGLAQAYLSYVLKTGRPEPSQDELSKFAPGSQSTWSRYFGDPEFWETVMRRLEVIWQAHSIAKQKYERAESNKEKERKSGVEPESVSNSGERGTKKTPVSNTEEANTVALVDLRMRYEKMSRPVLVKKVLACDPELKKSELEEATQEYLVELAIDLAA